MSPRVKAKPGVEARREKRETPVERFDRMAIVAKRASRLNDALIAVVDQSVGERVARAFELMEIAEEELKAAGFRRGQPAPFGCIHPTFDMVARPDAIYRAHARELCWRAASSPRRSLTPATSAEVMLVLSERSLRAPLRHDDLLVMERVFADVYGAEEAEHVLGPPRHHLVGTVNEIERDLENLKQEIAKVIKRDDWTPGR